MKKSVVLFVLLVTIAAIVFAASQFKSPTACSGGWTSCSNAFSDNTNRATATPTSTTNVSGRWNNYGFTVPSGATIDSVKVRADFFASNFRGHINVRVSGNGGATYGPSHKVGGNTAEQTFIIDVTSDLAWTPSMLNNGNFLVNVTCFKNQSGSNPTCRLDWIPMNVTYTEAPSSFNFTVAVNPKSASTSQGTNVTTFGNVTLVSGTSQEVTLGHEGCPPDASCSFNVSSGTPTFKFKFSVLPAATTPIGTYPINVTATNGSLTKKALYNLTVTDSCIRLNPAVQTTPLNQSGAAGTTLVYTVNVTNTDSSICAASDFNMTASIPSSWTGVYANSVLTNLSPGSSATTEFNLTSTANATAGSYLFTNFAKNTASGKQGAANATYTVI